jgi:putative tryptophan/tyrosine transport system substrate-binding protein
VGILWNPDYAPNRSRLKSMSEATQALGMTIASVEARGLDAFEQAFATMVRERTQAFVVLGDNVLFNYRRQISIMAVRNRLPTISSTKEFVEAGLLLSYGANVRELFRRSAVLIEKILKGAKPGDLPVEQPTKFELVVNLKTAKALGVEVPTSLLLRADEVIE